MSDLTEFIDCLTFEAAIKYDADYDRKIRMVLGLDETDAPQRPVSNDLDAVGTDGCKVTSDVVVTTDNNDNHSQV